MQKTAIINVVGLSSDLLQQNMPFLSKWSQNNQKVSVINPVLPAVTCTAQSTYLTGKYPSEHGIVANGWYFKDECELKLWRQSSHLVQAPKIWEVAREKNPNFTCANMFWWYAMNSSVDYVVTPRPQYFADGRKMPDCYSFPMDIRTRLNKELGPFPLFNFWGPQTNISSSKWIADASKKVHEWYNPDMTLVYLPHLDYNLQRHGQKHPSVQQDLKEIDTVCKDLIEYFERKQVAVTVLSGYGISNANKPIHINRILRKHHLISFREERGLEFLDPGTCRAVALADHQIAHIYIKNKQDIPLVKSILEQVEGIELLLNETNKKAYHLDHERSGDLVAIADKDSWFTYYYWLDDKKAPDFARIIDIHKKPGYDPVEMFLDPKKWLIYPRIALKVLQKKLGFRMLMDVIPLDAALVKGSHGRTDIPDKDKPVFISKMNTPDKMEAVEVFDWLLKQVYL